MNVRGLATLALKVLGVYFAVQALTAVPRLVVSLLPYSNNAISPFALPNIVTFLLFAALALISFYGADSIARRLRLDDAPLAVDADAFSPATVVSGAVAVLGLAVAAISVRGAFEFVATITVRADSPPGYAIRSVLQVALGVGLFLLSPRIARFWRVMWERLRSEGASAPATDSGARPYLAAALFAFGLGVAVLGVCCVLQATFSTHGITGVLTQGELSGPSLFHMWPN